MRLKSYFVHTIEEAMAAAKVELGDEAMLVESKRLEAPPGGRVRLEVIFAASAPPPAVRKLAGSEKPVPAGSDMQQRVRADLMGLLDALNREPDASILAAVSPAMNLLDELRSRLLRAEVPAAAVEEMADRCRPILEDRLLKGSTEYERAILPLFAAELAHEVRGDERAIAFVGPAGAGKTSAVAKLAFRLGVSEQKPVQVVSIDNLRIGASDQLAHVCSLLGVPFQSLDYSGALQAAVEAGANRGLILIDAPGYGQGDSDVIEETAANLARLAGLTSQLVLPATLRYSEMQRIVERFAPFRPSRVLFSRLDETEFFGPAWALARETRLSADWVSTGPGIPEDIEDADATRIASAVLGLDIKPAALASAASAGASRN